jgi:hypothetical protein
MARTKVVNHVEHLFAAEAAPQKQQKGFLCASVPLW